MAISRLKNWIAEVLTFSDLNNEFNNIIDNALSLISPLTGNLDVNQNQLTNLRVENRTSNPTLGNTGRVWWRSDLNAPVGDTGSVAAYIPAMQGLALGTLIVASGATGYTALAVGANGRALVADSSTATGLTWGVSANIIQVQVFS